MWLPADEHDLAEHELVVVPADRVRAREYRLENAVGLVTGRFWVLDPSKAQMGGFSPAGTILVFERSFWVGWVPSIQMYSAR